jgi:hypothetical protein
MQLARLHRDCCRRSLSQTMSVLNARLAEVAHSILGSCPITIQVPSFRAMIVYLHTQVQDSQRFAENRR